MFGVGAKLQRVLAALRATGRDSLAARLEAAYYGNLGPHCFAATHAVLNEVSTTAHPEHPELAADARALAGAMALAIPDDHLPFTATRPLPAAGASALLRAFRSESSLEPLY